MTWPVIIALRRTYKNKCFLGAGRPEYMELARSFGLFDRIVDCESREMLPFYMGKALPSLLQPLEAVLCWMKPDPLLASFLSNSGVGKVHQYPPFPDAN
ncbi:hypothetical protein ACFL5V_13335, partial [Fibrobacterota bacterium]